MSGFDDQPFSTFRSTLDKFGGGDERSSYIKPTDGPGPGSYQHSEFMGTGLAASIKGTFPKDRTRDGSYYNPGPGEYTVNRGFVEKSTPQYSIGGKYADTRKDELPGPGNYDANPDALKYTSPAPAFGKTRRSRTERTSDVPGPGEYAATVTQGRGFTIGGKTPSKIPYSPGPGQYETPEQQPKGFTIRHRPPEKSPESLPGPGLYEMKV